MFFFFKKSLSLFKFSTENLIFIFVFIEKNLLITQLNFQYLGSVNFSKYFSYIFTVLCFALYINSMNMIDGQNGLSGSLFASVIIFLIFKNQELFFHKEILIFILISIFIFLFFNFAGKVFLGDNGSTLLGFLTSVFCIYFSKHVSIDLRVNDTMIIWLLAYVSFEFLATTLSRLIRKKSIFSSGKDHFHYLV